MLIKCLYAASLLLVLCSCIVVREAHYFNTPRERQVDLYGPAIHLPDYNMAILVDDTVQIGATVLRHVGLNERVLPGVLLIDLSAPSSVRGDISFKPERIRVIVNADTLPLIQWRVTCGWPKECYHRAIFKLDDALEKMGNTNADSSWCSIDLTGALLYMGKPVEFGPLKGRLP